MSAPRKLARKQEALIAALLTEPTHAAAAKPKIEQLRQERDELLAARSKLMPLASTAGPGRPNGDQAGPAAKEQFPGTAGAG